MPPTLQTASAINTHRCQSLHGRDACRLTAVKGLGIDVNGWVERDLRVLRRVMHLHVFDARRLHVAPGQGAHQLHATKLRACPPQRVKAIPVLNTEAYLCVPRLAAEAISEPILPAAHVFGCQLVLLRLFLRRMLGRHTLPPTSKPQLVAGQERGITVGTPVKHSSRDISPPLLLLWHILHAHSPRNISGHLAVAVATAVSSVGCSAMTQHSQRPAAYTQNRAQHQHRCHFLGQRPLSHLARRSGALHSRAQASLEQRRLCGRIYCRVNFSHVNVTSGI